MNIPTPLVSGEDTQKLADAIADHVARLPHRPKLLGLGEPLHGEDEFLLLRNALFASLVDRAGFTSIALESSAWHGRVVDDYTSGGEGVEDEVMATGFTHEWGGFPGNRELVRWMREQNRRRPHAERLRFAGFDAPVEMAAAPSPRSAIRVLHDFLHGHGVDVPPWDVVDRLLGSDEAWIEPAAAREPARSIGREPRVHELRAIVDDLRRALDCGFPRSGGGLEEVLLAGRTAAGLLAYHAAMARDVEHRWQHLSALRDAMMAENLEALAERGPTLVFAHNQHLRTGTALLAFGEQTLRWLPAGVHVAERLGREDYRVIALVLGEASHAGIPVPEADTLEGVLHQALPPGSHLLAAPALDQPRPTRVSPTYRYIPADETLLGEVDEVLFVRATAER